MQSSKAFTTVGMSFLLSLSPAVAAIAALPEDLLKQTEHPPLSQLSPEALEPASGDAPRDPTVARLAPQSAVALDSPVTFSPKPELTSLSRVAAERLVEAEVGVEVADPAFSELASSDLAIPDKNFQAMMAEGVGAIASETQPSLPLDQEDTVAVAPDAAASMAIAPPETQSSVELAQTSIPLDAPAEDLSTEQLSLGEEVDFPSYLESEPNPLSFPTQPDQVRLDGVQPITLQQAIAIAELHNPALASARLELERSQAALQEQRAALLPQVRAGSELTFQEGQTQSSLEGINPITGEAEFGESGDEIDTVLGGSIRVDYDLFTSGLRSAQIATAERQLRLQQLEVEVLTEQLRLDVSEEYYNLQRTDEQLRIRQDALIQAEQNLQDAQALERAGVGTRFDVLQAQVDVANRQQDLTRALSDQQIARRQLVQRLDLDHTMNISASDPVAVAENWPFTLEESIILAFQNRAELEQRLVEREVSNAQRRAAISQYGPQVSLFGQYSVQNTLNDENSDFSDNYSAGIQLNWLLFDGGAARAQARQQEIGVAVAEENFATVRDAVRFQVESSFLNLQANQTNIATTELNVERATEALRLARLRFQSGVGTQSDVLQSQTDLTEAEFNRVEAILGYNESLANLRRAVSNLPNYELSDRP